MNYESLWLIALKLSNKIIFSYFIKIRLQRCRQYIYLNKRNNRLQIWLKNIWLIYLIRIHRIFTDTRENLHNIQENI